MDKNVKSDFYIWSISVNEFQWKFLAKHMKKTNNNKVLVCKYLYGSNLA